MCRTSILTSFIYTTATGLLRQWDHDIQCSSVKVVNVELKEVVYYLTSAFALALTERSRSGPLRTSKVNSPWPSAPPLGL